MCLCVHVCVHTLVSACEFRHPWRPEDVRFPGAGVSGSYELLDVGARNQTWVVGKSVKYPLLTTEPLLCTPFLLEFVSF